MNKKISKHFITVNNKTYLYSIKPVSKKMVFFECDGANIGQEFLAEDIPALLIDLPEMIIEEREYRAKQKKQKQVIRFRVSAEDKAKIMINACKKGFDSVSAYLRHLALKKGR